MIVTGIIVVAVILFGLAIVFRRVVPTNMVHIVQSAKKTTSYKKGSEAGNSYFEIPACIPFIGVSVTVFPESIFKVPIIDYEAYDIARLPFVVDVTAFFKVDDADKVAQRVSSFEELNDQLNSVISGVVRRVLATNSLEDILEARSSLSTQFTEEVGGDIKEWGVVPVKNIEFMDVRDSQGSKVIENIMAKEKSRIEMESRVKIAENKRQAELAEIETNKAIEVSKQDALEKVGIRTADKDKAVGIASELSNQEIKVQSKITAEKDMEITRVNTVKLSEITRDAAVIKAQQDQKVAEIKAEQDKTIRQVDAEANKAATILIAEGNLAEANNVAEGIRVKGIASADAEKAMLMAPVDTQIKLAQEIGTNDGYQKYLISVKQLDAGQVVGVEMAKSLQQADLKVIANSGDVQSGVAKLGDLFTTAGGTNLTGMIAALAQSDEGKGIVNALTARLGGEAAK